MARRTYLPPLVVFAVLAWLPGLTDSLRRERDVQDRKRRTLIVQIEEPGDILVSTWRRRRSSRSKGSPTRPRSRDKGRGEHRPVDLPGMAVKIIRAGSRSLSRAIDLDLGTSGGDTR
jgi:hypothetical protein